MPMKTRMTAAAVEAALPHISPELLDELVKGAVDEILDLEIGELVDVTGVFGAAPPAVSPGDDLFLLGLLNAVIVGGDTTLQFLSGSNFEDFLVLRDFVDPLESLSGNPFLVVAVPEPSTAWFLMLGLAALAARRRSCRFRAS